MPEIWTNPKTWVADELVTASAMNEQIRDNLLWLKAPPSRQYTALGDGDWVSSSTNWVDVDSTYLAFYMSSTGGDLLVHFHGTLALSATDNIVYFDLLMDGEMVAGDQGIIAIQNPDSAMAQRIVTVSFTRRIRNVSPMAHLVRLQWRVNTGSVRMYAGTTSGRQLRPQFWMMEIGKS